MIKDIGLYAACAIGGYMLTSAFMRPATQAVIPDKLPATNSECRFVWQPVNTYRLNVAQVRYVWKQLETCTGVQVFRAPNSNEVLTTLYYRNEVSPTITGLNGPYLP